MDTLKVCISWIVSRFTQCPESCLHQCAYTTAKYCLLSEKVCLCLCSEICLQKSCSCSTDRKTICKCTIQCFSCVILLYCYQTRSSLTSLIFTSYCMSRCFWRDHRNIYICRRYDLSEMDRKTMCKHQHVSFFQVRLNIIFIHCSLFFIIDQNHDHICFFRCLCCCKYFKSLCFCFCPGFAAFVKSDDDVASGFL